MSTATATANSNHVVFSKEQREWVDLLQEAHIGDVIACLSLTLALQTEQDEAESATLRERLEGIPMVQMPDDFIPPLKTLKVTDTDLSPLEDRFQHMKALDKRPVPLHGTPFPGVNLDVFRNRLDCLRRATKKWGESKVEAYFVQELNREYADIRHNGRKIMSTDDFTEYIQRPPWDAKKKGIVAFATSDMWGDNNQCCINFEKEFMRLIHAEFTGYKSNGNKARRIHKGKCVSTIIVKAKGNAMQKIRNWCRRAHKEGIYSRNEAPPTVVHALDAPNKTGVPRLVKQFTVAIEDGHGFAGILGICEGHSSLKDDDSVSRPAGIVLARPTGASAALMSPVTASLSSAEKASPTEAEQWLRTQSGVTSFEDLVKAITRAKEKESAAPEPEAENAVGQPLDVLQGQPLAISTAVAAAEDPPAATAETEEEAVTAAATIEKAPSMPSTPSKRKAREEDVLKTPTKQNKTPTKHRWDCDHETVGCFRAYDGSMGYFDAAYLKKTDTWPKNCASCEVLFVNKKEVGEGECKVLVATPAHLCRNGANSKHPCCYGLCSPCRKEIVGTSPTRKRKRKAFFQ